jgi:hypothetical protein
MGADAEAFLSLLLGDGSVGKRHGAAERRSDE